MTIRNLDALLQPRSVALIGASQTAGTVGATIAGNLLAGGFEGQIHLVNPRHRELAGQPCHRSLGAVGTVPDLVVIATPPGSIPQLVAEATELGCKAVVTITAGIDAATRQAMLTAARRNIVRILGPNSIGMMLPPLGLNASFAHRAALAGDIAFLSQSGALVTAIIDWATDRGIGFSHVLSLGDMADVDFGDLLDYLAGDTRSRAILLYMEAVTNAPKFMSAARRAARSKPVIVIKSGRHASAARAAASHTGRLAGSDAAYDAAFRRAGVLRVTALSELFEAAEMLARRPRITGERLTVLTNGGGAGVLAADHLADADGTLSELASATLDKLDAMLPPTWSRGNPVDVIGDAGPDRYAAALGILLADPDTDAVLAINCPTALASSTEVARVMLESYRKAGSAKPLVTNWLGDGAAKDARRMFAAAGVPTFETPRAAVRGFMQIVGHARAQTELMRTPPAGMQNIAVDEDLVAGIIARVLAEGRTMLSEAEAKDVIGAYGIPVARSLTASGPEEAAAAASRLLAEHEAVVLKILSHDITHKSDVGGVHLDLPTPEAVKRAAMDMAAHISTAAPGAAIKGFTVSPMIRRPRAYELLAGVTVDATFGPLVMFGAGGTAVEVVADTSMALPPLDAKLARDLVARTRISRLLAGYRDRRPADTDAIVAALVQLGALACRFPQIREIDINPLLADENGVIALDARIGVADEEKSPRAPLVVKPYPSEWVGTEQSDELGTLTVRPIRPEDEPLYEAFLARVSQEDMRMRLFAPMRHLSHRFLARMTQIDYAREMAFVALSEATGEMLGVSRLAADPDYETAEYGVLVRSDLKGKGLGWLLMGRLIAYAGATGLAEIHGSVLAENITMLKMCRDLGFSVSTDADDPAVRQVRLPVATGGARGSIR